MKKIYLLLTALIVGLSAQAAVHTIFMESNNLGQNHSIRENGSTTGKASFDMGQNFRVYSTATNLTGVNFCPSSGFNWYFPEGYQYNVYDDFTAFWFPDDYNVGGTYQITPALRGTWAGGSSWDNYLEFEYVSGTTYKTATQTYSSEVNFQFVLREGSNNKAYYGYNKTFNSNGANSTINTNGDSKVQLSSGQKYHFEMDFSNMKLTLVYDADAPNYTTYYLKVPHPGNDWNTGAGLQFGTDGKAKVTDYHIGTNQFALQVWDGSSNTCYVTSNKKVPTGSWISVSADSNSVNKNDIQDSSKLTVEGANDGDIFDIEFDVKNKQVYITKVGSDNTGGNTGSLYPEDLQLWLRGEMNDWGTPNEWKFTRDENGLYTLSGVSLTAPVTFKVGGQELMSNNVDWKYGFGFNPAQDIVPEVTYKLIDVVGSGTDIKLTRSVVNATITFDINTLEFRITETSYSDDSNLTVEISYEDDHSPENGSQFYIVTITPKYNGGEALSGTTVYYDIVRNGEEGNPEVTRYSTQYYMPFMLVRSSTIYARAFYQSTKSARAEQSLNVTTDSYAWDTPDDNEHLQAFILPTASLDKQPSRYLLTVDDSNVKGYEDVEYSWAKYYDYKKFDDNKDKTYTIKGVDYTYAEVSDHWDDPEGTNLGVLVGENTTNSQVLRHFEEFGDAYYRFYVHYEGEVPGFPSANNRQKAANHTGTVDPQVDNRVAYTYAYDAQQNGTTGVENVVTDAIEGADDANAPVIYYNLQGVRVENPANGVYIRVQGNKSEKVMLH